MGVVDMNIMRICGIDVRIERQYVIIMRPGLSECY